MNFKSIKYNEFKNKAEADGYVFQETNSEIRIIHFAQGKLVASVNKEEKMQFMIYKHFLVSGILYDLLTSLATTSLEEREDEKLYTVTLPTKDDYGQEIMLLRDLNKNRAWFAVSAYGKEFKQELTEQEIKDINPIYWEFRKEVE